MTGIADSVIDALKNHSLRTLEIRTPQNFAGVLGLDVGDSVLLTTTRLQDLTNGTVGLLGRVVQKETSTHSIIMANDLYIEEREIVTARVQLKCRCMARIRDVVSNEIGKPIIVVASEIPCYEAR